jgi:SAM-dependent methyltransferase
MSDYRDYWEDRLTREPNLRGTGHRAFSLDYNEILYQAQMDCLELVLAKHQVKMKGKRVLDVGSGTGFYVRFFKEAGAGQVVGIDITEASVEYLQRTFPNCNFHICDIGSKRIPVAGPFDVISTISVLYHLVDDARFERAIAHLGHLLSPDGYLLITDTFAHPLLPSASHARFRTLEVYRELLLQHRLRIVDVLPVYYLLNRTLMPLVGPFLLRSRRLQRWLYQIDKRWREEGRDNGRAMKLMLARKAEAEPTSD